MDTDAAGQTARQWLSRSPAGDDKDDEIARLRERLAFYQSFEGLIQDNIARSGELLRQAMEMRESAATEIAAAQAEAERRRVDDRARYRLHFTAMLDELTALQGQTERLARRLTSALDEIEADLPPGALTPALAEVDPGDDDTLLRALALDAGVPSPEVDSDAGPVGDQPPAFVEPAVDEPLAAAVSEEMASETVEEPPEFVVDDIAAVSDEPSDGQTVTAQLPPDDPVEAARPDDPLAVVSADIPPDVQPFAPEESVSPRQFAAENDLALQPVSAPEAGVPSIPAGLTTNATIVLVHGVPRATTALSLKRYLEGLAHVGAVEPREFAEGILRLEVSGARPLAFDDLRSWSEGQSLEPIHLRDNLVEVRLSQ
jgi:hypothetical protein